MKITISEKFFRSVQKLPKKQRELYLSVLLETYFDGSNTVKGNTESENKIIQKATKDGVLRRRNYETSVKFKLSFVKSRIELEEIASNQEEQKNVDNMEWEKREMTTKERKDYNKYVYLREEEKQLAEQKNEIKDCFKERFAEGANCLTYDGKPAVYYYTTERYKIDIPLLKTLDEKLFKKVAKKMIVENVKFV